MKEGWEEKSLGDFCEIYQPKTISKKEMVADGEYTVFGANGVIGRYHKYNHESSQLLITCRGATCGTINVSDPYSWITGNSMVVKPEQDVVDFHFLKHFLSQDQLLSGCITGAAQPQITRQSLRPVAIRFPPLLHEQRRIVAILDEAFEGIAAAKANAEKNLENAREVFESRLSHLLFPKPGSTVKKTLSEIAETFGRGKSRHRPRNAKFLFGGPYPFIQTGDIRNAEHIVDSFSQTYSEKGLAQSKLWPKGTVCITIAANIAESGILDFDACFPDSVIGVVVDPKQTTPEFLEFLLQAFKGRLQKLGKGSAQDNLNMGTFENQYFPFPDSIRNQEVQASEINTMKLNLDLLLKKLGEKITTLDELKKSLLHQAFNGDL